MYRLHRIFNCYPRHINCTVHTRLTCGIVLSARTLYIIFVRIFILLNINCAASSAAAEEVWICMKADNMSCHKIMCKKRKSARAGFTASNNEVRHLTINCSRQQHPCSRCRQQLRAIIIHLVLLLLMNLNIVSLYKFFLSLLTVIFWLQIPDHDVNHSVKIQFGFPVPLCTGLGI